jgi:hypothetical protein
MSKIPPLLHRVLLACFAELALHQVTVAAQPAPAPTHSATLETPNFIVRIEVNCPEGEVTCDRVTYRGKSKKTSRQITLPGKTVHTLCADGETPCRFVGYQFISGAITYLVTDDGELIVQDGGKVIVDEHGTLK